MQTLHVVYLDRAHLGDELFLKSLAQHFAEGKSGEPPCVLVHGSGEKVERTLESKGYFPERSEGVLDIDGDDQRRLVERAVRETNQEIVAALTDQVVSSVGIQGVDRNLLCMNEDGEVTATNVGWLAALVKQRIVPVISALVEGESGPKEVWAADVAIALVRALSTSFDPVVTVLQKDDHPFSEGVLDENGQVPVDDLSDEQVSDPDAVRRMSEAGVPVMVTDLQNLLSGESATGTRISGSA